MPREPEPSNNDRTFLLQALKQGLRLDGRELEKFRKVEISFGDEYGLADVRLGKTRVMARISAEVTTPYSDRPFDGIFTITTELGPMASPGFEVGRQTEQEVLLSRILEKSIRRSNALDTESLCIVSGEKCWSVRADVHFVDHDGNLLDTACIAVVAALAHFRRPDISVEGNKITIHTLSERVPVPLSLLHWPICVTFSFANDGQTAFMDATLQEEAVREGDMTVTMNRFGEVCQISKAGGGAGGGSSTTHIEAKSLFSCCEKALVIVNEITETLRKRLEEDEEQRRIRDNLLEAKATNDRGVEDMISVPV